MFKIFAAYLVEKAGLNDKELKQIEDLTVTKKLRKRQYLLQEGDISDYRAFITKGCLRMYYLSTDGIEHTIKFAVENWWITDDESYNSGGPTKYNIDALENSELLLIKKENLNLLFNSIPKFRDLKDRLGIKRFEASQNRILSSITETAEKKYDNFIRLYPQIYNRVPLHMVASYLGLSRETLSRVRKKYAKYHSKDK
ncbi:cyclic nucleotide-binding protein [Pedobacter lusitanus]|uniref:Cyclic nucleotide-binding protein n=1 Tax=Pedobacter lusitanus TaxID=1503925 RepID=A0A0D0GBP5_9SPHI|nr:Crp/Fnr family transcriptional regulator [Pedobacter lusitanus]KIO74697.1 cyclic nucleotide-binding protein [Pedobacter lusitanus]